MTGRFDAVLFDAGGVLVLPDPTVIIPLLAPYGGSADVGAHRRAHYAGMAAKSRAGSAEGVWGDYDVAYVAAVGVEGDDADLAADVLGCTRNHHLWRWPIPETLVGLSALSENGAPMGVVSNASGQVEAELRRRGICQVGPGPGVEVAVVVDSHVVGIAKPDPAIFDIALGHFDGIDRARTAYVGDSVTMDVRPAAAAGLVPILLDPYDDHPDIDVERIRAVDAMSAWW